MKYDEWLEIINNIDFERTNPEFVTYYLMRDNDLSNFEHDNLRNYTYMLFRFFDINKIYGGIKK